MISKDKKYQLRDGTEYKLYEIYDDGVHGAYLGDNKKWYTIAHGLTGRNNRYPSEFDLIEVKPRIQREVWVNVYKNATYIYHTKYDADRAGSVGRIACVKLDIDCEEGEGL